MRERVHRWLTQRFWRTRFADFDRYTAEVNWLRSPLLQRLYINPLLSGQPDKNWLEWLREKYFPQPAERALSLGCGRGKLERLAVERNLCRRLEACDLSPDAIAEARADAERAGLADQLNFFVADLNAIELPANTYDLLLCPMSLHHVSNLEGLFAQARQALRPTGLLVLNEYVGPVQFQWSDNQLRYANELLQRLPRRYRRNLDRRFGRRLLEPYRRRVRRRPRWRVRSEDPSESVCSAEIVPRLEREFDIVERKDYGGTLLQLVLDRIVGNFQDTEEDRRVLRELCDTEQKLIRQGELPSDFTLIVARPRSA
ncbi:MAG: class I SAM-dependent methyltransferase [Candidatus Acidoferrales bacterium]